MKILKEHKTDFRRTFLGKENNQYVVWSNNYIDQIIHCKTVNKNEAITRYNLWEKRSNEAS